MNLLLLAVAWAGICVACTFLFATCLAVGQSRGKRHRRTLPGAVAPTDGWGFEVVPVGGGRLV